VSQRIRGHEILRRLQVPSRNSAQPDLRVQADLDSSRGYSALGAAASDVFGKLGQAAQRIALDRTVRKSDEDTAQGQKDRTVESLNGAEAQTPQSLAEKTAGYRRGYYLTEGANRIHAAKLEIAKEVAGLRPGEDISPIVQKRMASILEAPEFQDPAILKDLQPALQQMQQGVAEYRQKTELAEIFDSQAENLRQMARDGVKDGSLLTAEGVKTFRAALNTEPFAFLGNDDADDILSAAYIDLIESGEIDPEQAQSALQKPIGDDKTSLWDREGWGEKFETAVTAGATVRARQFEEQQAQVLSGMEYQLQGRAQKGQLSIGDITALADKVGMQGKDRLMFVRRWIDQNDAGLKHMQSEANRAREHKETIAAINAGNVLSLTDAKLNKSAETEWAHAVASGDRKLQGSVIERYTRAGVVIPQLKDLLARTTERNLTANYNLYAELAKVDRIVADRYLSEANATLFAQHHDNITQFGMTPEESIQALPTGATKGRRQDVAQAIAQAAVGYYKDNPTMADGSPRSPQVSRLIEQEAIRLGMANPNATPADNLKVAERRALGGLVRVNGRWVPRGSARVGTESGIEATTRAVAKRLVDRGALTPEIAAGVYAAPLPTNPNVFAVLLPTGYPATDPTLAGGDVITFDPLEAARLHREFEDERTEALVRASARYKAAVGRGSVGLTPWYDGKRQPSLMTQADVEAYEQRHRPISEDGEDFPEFLEFIQRFKRQRKQAEQGQR